MNTLKMPLKMPTYRESRTHESFLCRLKEHLPSRDELETRLLTTLSNSFAIEEVSLEKATQALLIPHRKSTIILNFE